MGEWLTLDEAAALLKLKPDTVRRNLLLKGRLPGRKLGKQWRIDRDDVERLLRDMPEEHSILDVVNDAILPAGNCLHHPTMGRVNQLNEQLADRPPPIPMDA